MPTNNNTPLQDALLKAKDWKDLENLSNFHEARQGLLDRERRRVYMKRKSQEDAAILRAAKAAVEAGTLKVEGLE